MKISGRLMSPCFLNGEYMTDRKRVIILDEARGFFVICMIIYHFLYSYQYVFNLNEGYNLFDNSFMKYFQIFISGSFIFISGISSWKSKDIMKRGIKLFTVALIISAVTFIAIPEEFIVFGILHFLGFSMITLGLIKKYIAAKIDIIYKNSGIIILLCLFLLIICYNVKSGYIGIEGLYTVDLPESLYRNIFTSLLGFPDAYFRSADYFPLIPHIFMFYAGVFFEILLKDRKLSEEAYKKHSGLLEFAGRNSLMIYILHQPIIFIFIYIYIILFKNL